MKSWTTALPRFTLRWAPWDNSPFTVTTSYSWYRNRLPLEYLEKYTTRIRAVEPDQIQAAGKKYMAPDESAVVVVGDASQIRPALEKFGKVEVVQPK